MGRSDERILQRLENKAVHYLGRYASTELKLAQVLERFARRKLGDEDPGRMAALIRRKVEHCARRGYVDDGQYARLKAGSMRLQGASSFKIRQKLEQAGVDGKVIGKAIDERDAESGGDAEAVAALVYARRRRLGPFARIDRQRDGWRERHFASLARAGFSPDITSFVLDFEGAEAAQAWLEHPESR